MLTLAVVCWTVLVTSVFMAVSAGVLFRLGPLLWWGPAVTGWRSLLLRSSVLLLMTLLLGVFVLWFQVTAMGRADDLWHLGVQGVGWGAGLVATLLSVLVLPRWLGRGMLGGSACVSFPHGRNSVVRCLGGGVVVASGLVLLGILNWNGEDPMGLLLGLLFVVVFGLASGVGLTGLMGGAGGVRWGRGASA